MSNPIKKIYFLRLRVTQVVLQLPVLFFIFSFSTVF